MPPRWTLVTDPSAPEAELRKLRNVGDDVVVAGDRTGDGAV